MLPPPGPDHYHARRARWLASTPHTPPPHAHPSIARLDRALATPYAHPRTIDHVWGRLASGDALKHRLPMALLIKIVHAVWRRDPQIWPGGAVPPDSDESHPNNPS